MKAIIKKPCFIRLTQGLFTEVDEKDVEWLSKNKWYAHRTTSKASESGKYYAARHQRINGVEHTIYMHREITKCPTGKEVDHRNGKSLCNKRDNLRVCTRAQNNKYRNGRNMRI